MKMTGYDYLGDFDKMNRNGCNIPNIDNTSSFAFCLIVSSEHTGVIRRISLLDHQAM